MSSKRFRLAGGLLWAIAPFGGCALFPSFGDLSAARDAGKAEDANRQDGAPVGPSAGHASEVDGGSSPGDASLDAADEQESASLVKCDGAASAVCAGACVDLASNADHCGVCGHGCLGRPCAGGRCEADILVSGLQKPFDLSVLAESAQVFTVYWADVGLGTVSRLEARGGQRLVDLQFVTGLNNPIGVLVDSDNGDVYWTDLSPGSLTGPLERWSQGTRTVVATAAGPYALALDGQHLYWAYTGGPACPDAGADAGCVVPGGISMRNKDGSGDVVDLALVPGSAYGLAIDDSSVYASAPAIGAILVTSKTSATGAISCPSRHCLATGQSSPAGVAVRGGTIYWANTGNQVKGQGSVWRAATTGATPVAIVVDRDSPFRIAVDDSGVYWTEYGADGPSLGGDGGTSHTGGTIMRADFDGTGARSLYDAPVGACPHFIATDAVSVFWTDPCLGQLLRVAK